MKKEKPVKKRYNGIPSVSHVYYDGNYASFEVWASKKTISRIENQLKMKENVFRIIRKSSFNIIVFVNSSDHVESLRTGIMTEIFLSMFFTGRFAEYQGNSVNQAISAIFKSTIQIA